jgi:hypothetical protein
MIHLHVWGGGMCCEVGSHVIHLCTFLVPTCINGLFLFIYVSLSHFSTCEVPFILVSFGVRTLSLYFITNLKIKKYILPQYCLSVNIKTYSYKRKAEKILLSSKSWQPHYICFDNDFFFKPNKRWVCIMVTTNIWLSEHTQQNITQEV